MVQITADKRFDIFEVWSHFTWLCKYIFKYPLCLYQGKEVIEYYINELLNEGITYIPPWVGPPEEEGAEKEENPSQDSGLRSSSDSMGSQHSLVLGATAASIHRKSLTPPDGMKLLWRTRLLFFFGGGGDMCVFVYLHLLTTCNVLGSLLSVYWLMYFSVVVFLVVLLLLLFSIYWKWQQHSFRTTWLLWLNNNSNR